MAIPGTIFLTGLRGSGKTTVGKELARKINYRHLDQDNEFFKKYGPISSYVAQKGWNEFYKAFHEVFVQMEFEKTVLSTGGSVFIGDKGLTMDQTKVSFCREKGMIIMLSPTKDVNKGAEILFSRIKNRETEIFGKALPPQSYESFKKDYQIKHPRYIACADTVIYDNNSVSSAVRKILSILEIG